jgi:glucose-1-phosphate thymidylyltransferase
MREGGSTVLEERQRVAADSGQKAMMPIGGFGGRPFLDYVLSALADAGCTEVCLVVAPDHAAIRAHYDDAPPARIRASYAVQPEPTGTAQAVLAASAFAGADPFLVLNADNLYPVSALAALVSLTDPGLAAFESGSPEDDSGFDASRVAQFALVTRTPEGRLQTICEKPDRRDPRLHDPRTLVSMNLWRFDARIVEACRDVPRSARGEFELPEAVALAVSRGVAFSVVIAKGAVLDLTRRDDVSAVSRRLEGIVPRP